MIHSISIDDLCLLNGTACVGADHIHSKNDRYENDQNREYGLIFVSDGYT